MQTEKLLVDGQTVYVREHSQVSPSRQTAERLALFTIDWHFVALRASSRSSLRAILSSCSSAGWRKRCSSPRSQAL